MASDELLKYVRMQIAGGMSLPDLKKALGIQGWTPAEIEEAMLIASAPAAPAPASSAPAPAPLSTTSVLKTAATVIVAGPVVAAAQMLSSAPAPAASASPVQQSGQRPASMAWFEWLMYASVLIGVVSSYLLYASSFSTAALFNPNVLLMVLPAPLIAFLFVFLTARRKSNVLRIILAVLVLYDVSSAIVGLFGNFALLAVFGWTAGILLSKALAAAGLLFLFTKESNIWFGQQPSTPGVRLPAGTKNQIWTKGVPGSNFAFLVIVLGLVFIIDLGILMGSPDLWPFFAEMLAVAVIFFGFFLYENITLSKKYADTQSSVDGWLVTIISLRNIAFVLNSIPGIQILGAMLLLGGGIPFLIIYAILLNNRNKSLQAS